MVVTDATLLRRHLFLLIMLWRLTTTLFRRSVIVILNLNRNIVRPQPIAECHVAASAASVNSHETKQRCWSGVTCFMLHPKICCCNLQWHQFAFDWNCTWTCKLIRYRAAARRCSQSGKGSNVSANFNMPTCNFHDMPCHRCISLLSNVWKYGLNRLFSPAQGYNDMEWDMVRWPGDHLDSSKRKFMSHQTPWRLVCATELAWNGSSALSW